MAITSKFLKGIEAEARPIIERQMNDAKIIAGLRDVVAAAGGDWGALKALIKARVEDDNDETGEGKRVRKVREKADCIVAYDDMLGSNMNEKNFSASQSYAEAKGVERTELEDTVAALREVSRQNGANFDGYDAETRTFPVERELTDTQEQPETDLGSSDPQSEQPSFPPVASEYAGTSSDENPAPISNPQPAASLGADKAADVHPPSSPAALSEADVPAFLKSKQRKTVADYRPHCKHPDNCGSSNPTGYCYQCRRAMEAAFETEAAV